MSDSCPVCWMFLTDQASGATPLACPDSLLHSGSGGKWHTRGGRSRSGVDASTIVPRCTYLILKTTVPLTRLNLLTAGQWGKQHLPVHASQSALGCCVFDPFTERTVGTTLCSLTENSGWFAGQAEDIPGKRFVDWCLLAKTSVIILPPGLAMMQCRPYD